MTRTTPLVDHAHLRDVPDALPIVVGTAEWYAWLDDATTFAYVDDEGRFTARKERRGRDGWYWTAYRKRDGKLHRAYLGTSATLTLDRLTAAATALAPGVRVAAQPRTSPPPGASPAPAPPAHPILATKLYVPRMRPTLLSRPRLLARLACGLEGPLTLLSAPAGYGKTTLLGAWRATAAGSAVPLAWVSLDTADQDPARFWGYVITALDALQPGVAAMAIPALQSLQPPSIEAILTGVLNVLETLRDDAVLVLDDYHVLQSLAIHGGMTFLLDHLPPQLHLVITTREDPPLPLARLRARGQLTELRAADLRFTPEEAAAFLQTLMGLPLTDADVGVLETHTEGWIAGLQLAALSLQDRSGDQMATFIDAFTGSNRFVLDYLVSEVLDRLPPHLHRFVLHTSILDRMCAPLCDAMLTDARPDVEDIGGGDGTPFPGHARTHALLLDELERLNLFVVPLDDERHWYRYHHLFADVLRERLLRGTVREDVAALHRRASAWFVAQRLYPEALQHALAAEDWAHAGELIEQHGRPIIGGGQVMTVLGWIDALPAALVTARPRLTTIHAALLIYTNQLDAAETRLRNAEHWAQSCALPDQARLVLGQVATLRATLTRFGGDLARSVAFADQALDLLPETDVFGRAGATVSAAHAFLVRGDVTAVVEHAVREVAQPAHASGNLHATLRSFTLLARLHLLQGRLTAAEACYQQAVQAIPNQDAGLRMLVGSGDYYAGLGDLLRERNDLDGAERLLRQSLARLQGTFAVEAEIVTLSYLALARLQRARGDATGALATLQLFFDVARQRSFFVGLVRRGAAVQAQVWLMQGQFPAAADWADGSGLGVHDAISYLQETEYLTLARVEITRRHEPGGALTPVFGMLDRLLAAAEQRERMHTVIEILILRALAWQAQGDLPTGLPDLERALTLAAPEGYVRIFLDEAAPMATLLAQVARRGSAAAGYAAQLLAAFPDAALHLPWSDLPISEHYAATHQPPPGLVEPLSRRELEILGLIAAGHSNQAIADRLIVAVSTIKKHINNIYGKLEVQSRTQALARARALHLL